MIFADSHCHLDDPAFAEDLPEVLTRFRAAGGKALMIAGINQESSRQAVCLAEVHKDVYASVGIHPHDAADCTEETLPSLISLARHPRVKAWGEIGLDYNRMHSPRETQERIFLQQLEAADNLGLPLIFHERDTEGRFLELLKAHPNPSRRGVVHCFSGTDQELDEYLALGLHIGITGVLTLKARGEGLRAQAPRIPADRLLIETDAPYLTPTPERNQYRRNEPAFVRTVLLKLAQIRGEDPEALATVLWDNTCRLFGIGAAVDA